MVTGATAARAITAVPRLTSTDKDANLEQTQVDRAVVGTDRSRAGKETDAAPASAAIDRDLPVFEIGAQRFGFGAQCAERRMVACTVGLR